MQLTYSANMAPAIAGTLYDLSDHTIDAYAAEGADISFGMGLVAGTDPVTQCKLPAGAVTGFKGIALMQAKEQTYGTGTVAYIAKDTVPVVDKGRVWAPVIGAVTADGAVYLIHTGAGLGKFTGSAGANQGLIANAKFKTSTTGDGIAVVELR